jgi:hypothetical protein
MALVDEASRASAALQRRTSCDGQHPSERDQNGSRPKTVGRRLRRPDAPKCRRPEATLGHAATEARDAARPDRNAADKVRPRTKDVRARRGHCTTRSAFCHNADKQRPRANNVRRPKTVRRRLGPRASLDPEVPERDPIPVHVANGRDDLDALERRKAIHADDERVGTRR